MNSFAGILALFFAASVASACGFRCIDRTSKRVFVLWHVRILFADGTMNLQNISASPANAIWRGYWEA